MQSVKTQRIGLSVVFGTLLAICLVAYLSLERIYHAKLDSVRDQGMSLVQLVTEVPASQLTSQNARNSLSILKQSLRKDVFAYAVVVDSTGRPLSQVTDGALTVPAAAVQAEPSAWNGEREVKLLDGTGIVEFYSPFLIDSEYRGSVRLGFYKPERGVSFDNISSVASLALPVFLLAPLFYILMRRQISPLLDTQEQIAAQLQSGAMSSVELNVDGELGEFMNNFNEYCRRAKSRIEHLESDNHSMLASSKVLSYKFSRIESVIEALPQALIVFDDSGSLVYANNKVEALLGCSKETVLSQPVAAWSPNDDVFQFLARCSDPSNRALPELKTELDSEHTSKTLSFSAYPLFASTTDARSQGNLVLIRDASQERAAESSREEFVAHISHELKTPLNTLMLYSESLLGEDGRDEQFRAEGLNVIFDEAERMAGLINNLLSITKIEMGSLAIDRQRVKFDEFIEDTFRTIEKGAHESGLRFELKMPEDGIQVAIDKDLMRIAVNNLLTNAVKYNREYGTVTLEVEDYEEAVRIIVRDTGIGISEQDLKHVFDKFYRSDSDEVRDRTGHGLGLSLAFDIVKLHNGRLSAASELNVGSEFTIELFKETALLRKVS